MIEETECRKVKHWYQDVYKNEVKFVEFTSNIEVEKKQNYRTE